MKNPAASVMSEKPTNQAALSKAMAWAAYAQRMLPTNRTRPGPTAASAIEGGSRNTEKSKKVAKMIAPNPASGLQSTYSVITTTAIPAATFASAVAGDTQERR